MRSGRSALGVMAGVLLGLSVVLAGSGFGSYGGLYPRTSVQYIVKTNATGTWQMSSGISAGSNSTNGQGGWVLIPSTNAIRADVASHLDNIARQPITLTGFALLPVFAALLVGFVFYRVHRVRNDREEPPEAA